MKRLNKCKHCGIYTLEGKCPSCKRETVRPAPARFSPEDRYVRYRLEWRLKHGQDNNQ